MGNINLTLKPNHAAQVLRYRMRRLGWQGLVGILLIFASLLFLLIVAIPKSHQLQQLQIEMVTLKANPRPNLKNGSNHAQFDVVQKFYDFLPLQNEVNNQIIAILHVATNVGLVVDKVEYVQPLTASPLIQYQIKLPLKGSYIQIRQFISQVLNASPSMALNDLSLRREDLATELVEAQIQFNLYMQKEKQ